MFNSTKSTPHTSSTKGAVRYNKFSIYISLQSANCLLCVLKRIRRNQKKQQGAFVFMHRTGGSGEDMWERDSKYGMH